ncbi:MULTISPECIES: quinone oxidoreductase family protein [Rhizobium/Agrobacterium group]|uniref:quinone oxidoreductase family protein n=1 Tax=Rhizobium/Agrobacterium group TaxID=227290 RepID=UPI002300ED83|nr:MULTISPECIES: zinc-binding alcohol dehydrogenase family protein [Rhizobium/Agrobacterium group]MDA5635987.1 zinc-binding alcohol dehydrogenase family protein [Agrobacterium sp. ST15.16.024]MDF1891104.1 zinc-binding alcohol dehydrogenase family protein [Rhizobium rhizogenes]
MKATVYDRPGSPDVLRYVDVPDPVCASDGVLIRIEAAAIEGGDLINRASTPAPHPDYVVGYSAAGKIIAIGENVSDRHVGQRVTSFDLAGSHAELRAVAASRTWLVPEGLDMVAAAALPIAFGTAHHCLFARGGLKRGETVLIQAGAGGVGLAAIQLAQQAGATVLATVSGSERIEPLLGLGLDHAIDHHLTDIFARVMYLTEGRGVDLVVDPVGATTLQNSLAALRPEGRLVFVGNAGGSQLSIDLWPALQANQSLFGVFMGTQLEKPDVYDTVSGMLDRAAGGTLKVIVDRTFPLMAAAEAHAYAEGNSILGRVVIVPAG